MRKPSVLTRAREALRFFRQGYRPSLSISQSKEAPFIWPGWRKEVPQWQIVNYEAYVNEGFNLNAVVYSAIMYKVRALGQTPLRAYSGDPDNPEPVGAGSPLADLVFRPNPYQSFMALQSTNVAYLNIHGNAYILLDRPKLNAFPTAIYTMRPDRVFIIPDKERGLLGYLYVPEGKGWRDGDPILPQDVIHIKFPNPGDPLEGLGYGLSPMSCMARTIDVDNAITHFLKLFFDKGVMVPGILSSDKQLNPAIVSRVRERWKELYGGYHQWAEEIGILEDGVSYQRVGLTFDEMGFDGLDERNESRILAPFGVAPILTGTRVGLNRATYSNYEQARQATWEDTLVPELKLFETEYQYKLQYKDEWVKFDISRIPALIEAAAQKRQEAQDAFNNSAITRNEYRVTLGYPSLEGGDVYKVSLNSLFIPSATLDEDTTPAPVEATDDVRDKQYKVLDQMRKESFYKVFDDQAVSHENEFGRAAENAFKFDLRNILAIVNTGKSRAKQLKQTPNWAEVQSDIIEYLRNQGTENWRAEFIPVLSKLVLDRGETLNVQFGIQFDVQNILAEEWFDEYTIQFAQIITDSTEKTIRAMFQQGMNEGWSIDRMSNHLEILFIQWMKGTKNPDDFQWFEERMPPWRRELIARTETISASNAGALALYGVWGAPYKEWLTQIDGRQRPSHEHTNTQVQPIDKPFQVNGSEMMYPGDKDAPVEEIANCRCTLLPVFDGDMTA